MMRTSILEFLFVAGAGTVNQIAAYLEDSSATLRVLRYKLKQLEKQGIVTSVGEVKFQVLGRPQTMYTLTSRGKAELGLNLKEKIRGRTSLTRCMFRAEYMIHNRDATFSVDYSEKAELCKSFGIKWNSNNTRVLSEIHGTVIGLRDGKLLWGVPLLQYKLLANVISSLEESNRESVEVCILCKDTLKSTLNKRIAKLSSDAVPRSKHEIRELFNKESDPEKKDQLLRVQRDMGAKERRVIGFDFTRIVETFPVRFEYLTPDFSYV